MKTVEFILLTVLCVCGLTAFFWIVDDFGDGGKGSIAVTPSARDTVAQSNTSENSTQEVGPKYLLYNTKRYRVGPPVQNLMPAATRSFA